MQKSPLLMNNHILCMYDDIFTPNLHGNARRLCLTAHFLPSNWSKITLFCILFVGWPHGKLPFCIKINKIENPSKSVLSKDVLEKTDFFFKMLKNRSCELTVISRLELWKNRSPKSQFLPRFFVFRPRFSHQEYGANLKNDLLRVH